MKHIAFTTRKRPTRYHLASGGVHNQPERRCRRSVYCEVHACARHSVGCDGLPSGTQWHRRAGEQR
jgi:hypothetical protein